MNSLQNLIENNISPGNNSVFIISSKKEISYREFEESAAKLASYFEDKGLKEGDNVAVISDNNPDFILLIFST